VVRAEKQTTNDNEELSQEDYQLITTIVLGWFFLRNLLMKLTPEDYAEKVFLKIGKSNKKPATIRLLFDLIREKSNSMRSPNKFNQMLAEEMLDKSMEDVAQDMRLLQSNQKDIQHYLDSRRMSEMLRYLKDRHILKHIPGKQAIRKEMHRLPGRVGAHSFDRFGERFGGKPSAYKKTTQMESLARLLQKTKARNLVYAALKEANILYDYKRFMLTAFYIAQKKCKLADTSRVHKIIKAINNNPIEDWKIKSMQEQIANLDEYQIKQLAADRAKESIERRKDDAYFLAGLFNYDI